MSGVDVHHQKAVSMTERARNWLKSNPSLVDVRKAQMAVVAKAESEGGDLSESRKTSDLLSEYFVDLGGDLDELSMFRDEQPEVATSACQAAQLDLSPLCPDGPISAPLAAGEKLQLFQDLQRQFGQLKGRS